MASLIDSITGVTRQHTDGKWYIAKPLQAGLKQKLKDIFGIITGKYTAVYFKEDERSCE